MHLHMQNRMIFIFFYKILQENQNSVQDVKGDRMYVKKHSIKILGFIQKQEEFQIVKTTRLPNITVGIKS